MPEQREPSAFAKALARNVAPPPHPLKAYRDDPVAFAHDCIEWPDGKGLTRYQEEILSELPKRHRIAVRGPHGLGKSTLEAIITLWFAVTRDGLDVDWKAGTTASSWNQLRDYLWPEIHKWARYLRWDKLDRGPFSERTELMRLQLQLGHGHAFSASPADPGKVEGAHADAVLFVFDESKSIADEVFDAIEGAFAGAGDDTGLEAYAAVMSTPGEPQGRFYDIHRRAPGFDHWWVRHVTVDEAIRAKRISAEWVRQMAGVWPEGSAMYANRVLGEFASSDDESVIPLAHVEAAMERWRDRFGAKGRSFSPPGNLEAVGVDLADIGGDRSVFARRYDNVVGPIERVALKSLDETGDAVVRAESRVRGILDAHGCRVVLDVVGMGASVYGRLRAEPALRRRVQPFNAGASTRRRDHSGELGFADVRSAAWWGLRELLDPDSGAELCLPPDDTLTGDLTAPHWREVAGRVKVESKAELRRRLKRSTDVGDAVVQAFWTEESGTATLVRPSRSVAARSPVVPRHGNAAALVGRSGGFRSRP